MIPCRSCGFLPQCLSGYSNWPNKCSCTSMSKGRAMYRKLSVSDTESVCAQSGCGQKFKHADTDPSTTAQAPGLLESKEMLYYPSTVHDLCRLFGAVVLQGSKKIFIQPLHKASPAIKSKKCSVKEAEQTKYPCQWWKIWCCAHSTASRQASYREDQGQEKKIKKAWVWNFNSTVNNMIRLTSK